MNIRTRITRRARVCTNAISHILTTWLILIGLGGVATLKPQVAEALPASCTTGANFCVAPVVTPWTYIVYQGYSWPGLGPFYSESEAISATLAYSISHGGWCSVTPTSVTYDDGYGWGTSPRYVGSIEVFHANTMHFTIVGYPSQGCNQTWGYAPTFLAQRDVKCLFGLNLVYDTSVTPNVPFCQGSNGTWQPAKAICSSCSGGSQVIKGNPVDVTNRNKQQIEVDYEGAGANPLRMARTYNSNIGWYGNSDALQPLGVSGWSATYFQRLNYQSVSVAGTVYATIYAIRPTGQVLNFNLISGLWVSVAADVSDTLTATANGFEYRTAGNIVESYDPGGRLISIRQPGRPDQTLTYSGSSLLPASVSTALGQTLTFGYTTIQSKPRLTSVTDPAGQQIVYAYSTNASVLSATYQDGTSRQYTSSNWALSSIKDEAGVTYASWVYDGTWGIRESQHAGGVEHYLFYYPNDTRVAVTDPLGVQRTYWKTISWGVARLTSSTGNCAGCMEDKTRTYDTNGNVATRTDFNNNQTTYSFDLARNLETSRTEAYGTAKARTISTTWDSMWRSPTLITEPNRTTAFTYDANGNVLTRTQTDTATSASRVWTWTYDGYNRVLTENGPRTDVSDLTTYAYNDATATCVATIAGASATGCRGQLATITNALSQITTFNEYNGYGQPVKITDPNGVVTILTYDARQRLTSRTFGGEATLLEYWPTGLLKKVTSPDASFILYTYDAAHRLNRIEDQQGNRIDYTLDNMSNVTAENVYDPSNTLRRTHSRVFNTLNQLWKDVNAASTAAVTTVFGYDANNNQTTVNAPLGRNTIQAYDELNRLAQTTDAKGGVSQFGYDTQDNLVSVIDPLGLATSYTYTGFGDLKQQVSPDSGTTLFTYDAAGNIATRTDARGMVGTYTYDALNRVTAIDYAVNAPWISADKSYTYDTCTNGKGRLCEIDDASGHASWTYTPQGRVASKTQFTGQLDGYWSELTVSYGYNSAGQLTTITMPSGAIVSYTYANNRVSSIQVSYEGNTYPILSNVQYDPFGAVGSWIWGNGGFAGRSHDANGNLVEISSGALHLEYGLDNAQRVEAQTDLQDGTRSWEYAHDELDRLSAAWNPITGTNYAWTYDANGNRLTQTGSATFTYSYQEPRVDNRLQSLVQSAPYITWRNYEYDAMGNSGFLQTPVISYDAAGRFTGYNSYWHNALGQRTRHGLVPGYEEHAVFAEDGRVLGQYGAYGPQPVPEFSVLPLQETIWLEDLPVAVIHGWPAWDYDGYYLETYTRELLYVHTDHLGAPRRLTRPSDNAIVWRWDSDPFGNGRADGNVLGSQSPGYAYDLRFPGQLYDMLLQRHYNYFRDYDPAIGRYVESDPIGLRGGINTYAYVGGNPLSYSDPTGLAPPGRAVPSPLPPGPLAFPMNPQPWSHDAALALEQSIQDAVNAVREMCGDDTSKAMHVRLPLDVGGAEWGRRNGVGADEGRRRAHKIKQQDKGRPTDNYTVDPATGNVYDPNGDFVGNVRDVRS